MNYHITLIILTHPLFLSLLKPLEVNPSVSIGIPEVLVLHGIEDTPRLPREEGEKEGSVDWRGKEVTTEGGFPDSGSAVSEEPREIESLNTDW